MDKIKYVKLEQPDGSYSGSIPLAVDSDYVDVNGNTLTNELNNKATKDEVQAVASGSPAGVYATVTALIEADPDHSRIYVVSADGHWYYYTNNQWNDGGPYQSSGINTDKTLIQINTSADAKIVGDKLNQITEYKNLADISTMENGYYWGSASGKVVKSGSGSADNVATINRILLKANKKICIRQLGNSWFWLGDEEGNIISKLNALASYTSVQRGNYNYITFNTNSLCYLYCTIQTNLAYDRFMVTEDFLPFEHYDYNKIFAIKIDDDFINFEENIEIGDFYQSIDLAIAGIASDTSLLSENYKVNIVIPDGIYTITSELNLPNYVNIIGKTGNREKCVINFVPQSPSDRDVQNNSAVKIQQNNDIKNVTITAINARYVIHDESSNYYKNWKRNLENCTFIHYENNVGSWNSQNAYGEGSSSGSLLIAKNCKFITYKQSSYAYSVHNNTNFERPMKHYFENCEFISYNGGSIRCEGLASTTEDIVFINNCSLKGPIYLTNALSIKCIVSGSNLVQSNTTNYFATNSNAIYREFTETLLNNSGETIPAGTLVCYNNSYTKIRKMTINDNSNSFAGFTIGETLNGNYATVITKGFYRYTQDLTFGHEYGVNNGLPDINATNKIGMTNGDGFIIIN